MITSSQSIDCSYRLRNHGVYTIYESMARGAEESRCDKTILNLRLFHTLNRIAWTLRASKLGKRWTAVLGVISPINARTARNYGGLSVQDEPDGL